MKKGLIDVGTNSIKLSVYDYSFEREIFCKRVVTRLGERSFENKILIKEAMDRILKTLEDFVKISFEYGAERVEIVATSCVRDAKNKQEFLNLAKNDLGIDINVISGDKEAEIIFNAVIKDFSSKMCNEKQKTNNVLLADIGGGSTELILGNKKSILFKKSLDIGIVRMYDKFFMCPTDNDGYRKTMEYSEKLIEPLCNDLKKYDYFIGSSGTFTNIFYWIKNKNLCNKFCDRDVFIKGIHDLLEMPLAERKEQKGINPDRADIICAGGAIIEALCNKFNIKEISVTQIALKEGLADFYK